MKLLTTANKGQVEYELLDSSHKVKRVTLGGKSVQFKVVLVLEKEPTDYVELGIEIK